MVYNQFVCSFDGIIGLLLQISCKRIDTERQVLYYDKTYSVLELYRYRQESAQRSRSMNGHIDGLLKAEIGTNLAGGYDLVFYAELEDTDALNAFRDHPLHAAHRERCKDIVTDRLCGDLITTI